MSQPELRRQIVRLLRGDGAHLTYEKVLRGFPPQHAGRQADGIRHTAWQLLEHLRIAQWDILEFCRNATHVSPEFPQGYWPESSSPPAVAAWDDSLRTFLQELGSMQDLVMSASDLCASIAHTDGVSLLRQALLLADHNAYHLGQLVMLQKALEGNA